MLAIGDLYIFVSDFERSMRFWADGLQLRIAEHESTRHSAFARLDFPDGGPSLRLFGPVDPWEEGQPPDHGTRPTISFDITTARFDEVLVRLLDRGGDQVGEIESYEDLRSVTLRDPDGNTFELIELPKNAEA